MNRTLNVVRMQLVNRSTFIWVPLIVLGGTVAISLAIFWLLAGNVESTTMFGGGAQAPLWYFLAVGIQALTLSFPFAQAMSVTRREFYLGTLLTAALTSVGLAVLFVVGGLIESLTRGWGMNAYMFRLTWIWSQGPLVAGLFFAVVAMLFFVVGFFFANVYKRWGNLVLTVLLIALALVFIVILWIIGRADAWGPVFAWFGSLTPIALTGAFVLVIAALAAISYGSLRRAIA
ncbi:hypothetical protein SAMN05216488_2535 [Microbacterium sp. LKL04]|uniref:hypothetical protein n=1 Tax=Microbacterium sp. LKL04 TaxID=912630 RepID=UPI000875C591|nr:hypothetical protein [Microbacterium sp. LKL04]SCY61025.1 hypothetical protein SAMN05216488_2535 [Microbacterium sp. LKL04]